MSINAHSIAPGNDRNLNCEDLFLQYRCSNIVPNNDSLWELYSNYDQLFTRAVQYTPISANEFTLLQKKKLTYRLFFIGVSIFNALITFYIIYKLIFQDLSSSLGMSDQLKILFAGTFSFFLEVGLVTFVLSEFYKNIARMLNFKYSIRNENLEKVKKYLFTPLDPNCFKEITNYSKLDSQLKAKILEVYEYREGKLLDVDFEELNIRSILNCRAAINQTLKNHLDYEKKTQDILESIKSDKA
ncbi:hypothetical protein NQ656_17640 [Acinetobacter baumannii]|nr:hypothetical protein [Acinetobacter baumannii]